MEYEQEILFCVPVKILLYCIRHPLCKVFSRYCKPLHSPYTTLTQPLHKPYINLTKPYKTLQNPYITFQKIHQLLQIIIMEGNDDNIFRDILLTLEDLEPEPKQNNKQARNKYPADCAICKKTFTSTQGLKDHCKTKTHIEKAVEEEMNKEPQDTPSKKRKFPEEYSNAAKYLQELTEMGTSAEEIETLIKHNKKLDRHIALGHANKIDEVELDKEKILVNKINENIKLDSNKIQCYDTIFHYCQIEDLEFLKTIINDLIDIRVVRKDCLKLQSVLNSVCGVQKKA